MSIQLEPTGERVIEDSYRSSLAGYVIYLMHVASYRYVRPLCANARVLDLGCGSGYGAASLADIAEQIDAVDVAPDAVAFANARYRAPNLRFGLIDSDASLPFADQSFDVVLSFQVIEHVENESNYVLEARRVLKPGGVMVIVTPDRRLRLLPLQKPWNRWHLREYSMTSLRGIVEPWMRVDSALYMGAVDDVARVEIRRYRTVKWLMLPLTLPFIPEWLRRHGLDAVHALVARIKPVQATGVDRTTDFDFDESAMLIGSDVPNPMNLVLVARRQDSDGPTGA